MVNRLLQSPGREGRGRREVSHPGQNYLFRACHRLRVGSDHRPDSHPVESLFYRGKVSHAVIDNGNRHSSPLVLGNSRAIRLSRQQAARSARAKALNRASIL